jgi:APA family basic amino acid/polyamine antiporter
MSRHRHFFAFAGNPHPVTGVSAAALWLQAAWTIALLATQRFEQLLFYTTSAMLITGMLTVSAVVALRVRRPELERPYRTLLYPWAPLFFCGSSLLAIGVLVVRRDPSASMAVGWFVAALAAHALLRRRRPRSGGDVGDGRRR